MSHGKRAASPSASPALKKRFSPPTKAASAVKQGRRGGYTILGRVVSPEEASVWKAPDPPVQERRFEEVIPDSQSPVPWPKQEEDVKPRAYLDYRSPLGSSTSQSLISRTATDSYATAPDHKPSSYGLSQSLSVDSKPSAEDMSRSLSRRSTTSAFSSSNMSLPSYSEMEDDKPDDKPWSNASTPPVPRARQPRDRGASPELKPPVDSRQPSESVESTPGIDCTRSVAPSPAPRPKKEEKVEPVEVLLHRSRSRGRSPSFPIKQATTEPRMEESSSSDDDTVQGLEEEASPTEEEPVAEEDEESDEEFVPEQAETEPERDNAVETEAMAEEEIPAGSASPKADVDFADAFLSSVIPAPGPRGVKAMLQNRLALTTAHLPPEDRVLPLAQPPPPPPPAPVIRRPASTPPRPQPPLAPVAPQPQPVPALPQRQPAYSGRAPNPPFATPAAAPARHTTPPPAFISIELDDELEDYEDEEPAADLKDVLAPQPFFEAPTEAGTIHRWSLVIADPRHGHVPIEEGFSHAQLSKDVRLLQSRDIPVPGTLCFVLPRRFSVAEGAQLINQMPCGDPASLLSRTALDALWEDFGKAGEEYKHRPRWTPPHRDDWQATVKAMEAEGVSVHDLVKVLARLFVRGRRQVDDEVVLDIFKRNWLWFEQLRQLARVRRAYLKLASPNVAVEAQIVYDEDKRALEVDLAEKKAEHAHAREDGADREVLSKLNDEVNELRSGARKRG